MIGRIPLRNAPLTSVTTTMCCGICPTASSMIGAWPELLFFTYSWQVYILTSYPTESSVGSAKRLSAVFRAFFISPASFGPNPERYRPVYQLTPRDATVYYSSLALARLVSEDNPNQSIELLETIKGFFDPSGDYHLPEDKYRLDPPNELQLLPDLYERVERFEDSLSLTTPSSGFPFGGPEDCDAAIRRLNGWLDELLRSGGIGEVQRFLDQIYKWLQQANEIDNENREDISGCSNNTRQYWAWYYGYALGLLIKSRPHFRASLLDQVDAGE